MNKIYDKIKNHNNDFLLDPSRMSSALMPLAAVERSRATQAVFQNTSPCHPLQSDTAHCESMRAAVPANGVPTHEYPCSYHSGGQFFHQPIIIDL